MGHYGSAIGFLIIYIICSMFTSLVLSAVFDGVSRLGIIGMCISTFITEGFLNMFKISLYKYFIELNHGSLSKTADVFFGFSCRVSKHLSCSFFFSMLYMIMVFVPTQIFDRITHSTGKHYLLYSFIVYSVAYLVYMLIQIQFMPVYFIAIDFPDKSFGDCLLILIWLTSGYRRQLTRLMLSFIPIYILGILSFGIGLLWVIPYMYSSYASFYLNLTNIKSKTASY